MMTDLRGGSRSRAGLLRPMDPDRLRCHDHDGSRGFLQLDLPEQVFRQPSVARATLSRESEQHDARMRSGRVLLGIREALVSREQTPLLALDNGPQLFVRCTGESFVGDGSCVVSGAFAYGWLSTLARCVEAAPTGPAAEIVGRTMGSRSAPFLYGELPVKESGLCLETESS